MFSVHGWWYSGYAVCRFFASDQLGIFSGQGFAEGMSMSKQQVQAIGVISTTVLYRCSYRVILKLSALVMPLRVSGEEERKVWI